MDPYIAIGIGMGISNITYKGINSIEMDTTMGITASGGKISEEVSTTEKMDRFTEHQDDVSDIKSVKKIIAERTKGLDLNEHPAKTKQLSSKKMKELKEKIDTRTITKGEYKNYMWNKRFARKRKAGITKFWDMELERIINEKPTTRNWSQEQIQDILLGEAPKFDGKPIIGHHSYRTSKYPHLADKGEIIYPVTFNEHFNGWHGGNWRNSMPGEPYNIH